MILLDANILLYAYNADAPQHQAVAQWLTALVDSGETLGLPISTIWAFLRISTNSRIWPNPLAADKAFEILNEWLSHPGVVVINPGPRHVELLERVVAEYSAAGALLSDAVLAAMALENGATLASTDQDFRRFASIRWINPLQP